MHDFARAWAIRVANIREPSDREVLECAADVHSVAMGGIPICIVGSFVGGAAFHRYPEAFADPELRAIKIRDRSVFFRAKSGKLWEAFQALNILNEVGRVKGKNIDRALAVAQLCGLDRAERSAAFQTMADETSGMANAIRGADAIIRNIQSVVKTDVYKPPFNAAWFRP